MSDLDHFDQSPPRLVDEWVEEPSLRRLLGRILPGEVLAEVTPSLAHMGELASTTLAADAALLDHRDGEPRLVRYDPWGERIDEIVTHPAWDRIGRVAAEEGVVATGYERAHGEHSRVHQYALANLFAPSSGLYSCPLAMTDGAARTLEVHGDDAVKDRALPRLTSRDPDTMWTSGQWMTERTGGSDVGASLSRAVPDGDVWRLHGTKWFTSAVTSQMALTLARPDGNSAGGRGLAMFYLEVRDDEGRLNHIEVRRLKDKLGTRQMPTAELELRGTVAHLVGEPANGTRNIAPMLHVTRLWNAVSSVGGMRRAWCLARDYARRREAFGRLLEDQPLHVATLADLRIQHEAALQLTFHAVRLFGRVDVGVATSREEQALRLLLPLTKLVTAKQAVAQASEALESFGGAGYIEDTGLPVLLRDAQVLPIWEGTTNVLSLDALRAVQHDDAFGAFAEMAHELATGATDARPAAVATAGLAAVDHAGAWLRTTLDDQGIDALQHGARAWSYTLGRGLQAILLAVQAQHDLDVEADGTTIAVAERFARGGLDELAGLGSLADDATLVG